LRLFPATPLAKMRFLFYAPLIFGLPSLGWLFHYAKPLLLMETIFDLGLFDLHSLFQEHN